MKKYNTGQYYIGTLEEVEKRPLKKSLPLIVLGTVGLLIFVLLLDHFFPYKAANLSIGKLEAVAIGSRFMKQRGYDLNGYKVMVVVSYDDNAFQYLQKRLGWEKALNISRNSEHQGLNFYWRIAWYKNLPNTTEYENYFILISGSGRILGFNHGYPIGFNWPKGKNAHVDQGNAREIAAAFIKEQGIDLAGYKEDEPVTQKFDKRTDHRFSWSNILELEKGKVTLEILIKGDEVGQFTTNFEIPEPYSTAINSAGGRRFYSIIASYALAFLFWIVIQVVFLKKYHEGEVGVRSAVYVFFILWGALVIESVLKFKMNATFVTLGQLGFEGIAAAMFVLFTLILWPFFSIMGFSAWSVGESLGREKFEKKFTAIDSLFNRKFSTINASSSMLNGYFTGFIGLGIIAVVVTIIVGIFHGRITAVDYRIIALPFPYFIPILAAVSSALLSELVFRLFGNLILYKYLKSRRISLILSTLCWTAFAVSFWGIGFSLSPTYYDWALLYIVGLFIGYMFWKYDLLTVIVANFTIVGVMQSIPLITSGAASLFSQGIAALVILALPIIFIVRGYIRKKVFHFEADLLPSHIRRITERVRMAKELEIARQVQQKLLPSTAPEIEGFEIAGICIPANEVGGDYYDFIPVDKNKLGIVIGDVSGKGVPAAIYMTLTKGIIYSQVENRLSPEEVLIKVNRSLYTMMDHKSFVTLFIGVLDIESKTLRYSRAGHNPLLFFRCSDDRMISLKPGGIAVGIEKGKIFDHTIKEEHLHLKKGDVIVFYTDGFSEAMNTDLEEYGEKRLMETIRVCKDKKAGKIIDFVVADVALFTKGYPQHDDMTMVVLKIL